MDSVSLTVVALAVAGASLASTIALAVVLVRIRRAHQTTTQRLSGLQADLGALCNGAVGVGKRLSRIERILRHQDQRQDQLEMRDTTTQALGQAARLVDRGADIQEIMGSCGLSHGEAELFMLLRSGAAGRH